MICLDDILSSEKYVKIVKLINKCPQFGFWWNNDFPRQLCCIDYTYSNHMLQIIKQLSLLQHSTGNLRSELLNTPCSHLPSKTPLFTSAAFSDDFFSGNRGKWKSQGQRGLDTGHIWIQTKFDSRCLSISAHSHLHLHMGLTRINKSWSNCPFI